MVWHCDGIIIPERKKNDFEKSADNKKHGRLNKLLKGDGNIKSMCVSNASPYYIMQYATNPIKIK